MRQIDLAKLKQIIDFHPHSGQKEVLLNLNRFTIVNSGKRWGKSTLVAYLALKELFLPYKTVWVVAPTHDLSSRVWEYITLWIDKYFSDIFRINKHERIIENNVTMSKLWTKTGETPSSLLGKGLDLLIVDEASRMDNGIWDGYLRPNLMDRNGRAILISNPFGFNWFYDLYLKGLPESNETNPEYISFMYPTAIENKDGEVVGTYNPDAVSIQELQSIKRITPLDVWRVEYLGQFQEGAGQLFKNFDQCIDDSIKVYDPNDWFESPIPGHLYYVGVDIAKMEDFTVVSVVDRMTHRMVGFYRVNQVSWESMREKVMEISQRYYDAEITLDATGNAGDMFAENLTEIGANIDTEFKYSNKTKMMLIDKLSMFMSRGQIKFPRIPQLINEIRQFTYHFTDSGNVKYGSSKRDDCLNSLALACWNLVDMPLEETVLGSSVFSPKRRMFK